MSDAIVNVTDSDIVVNLVGSDGSAVAAQIAANLAGLVADAETAEAGSQTAKGLSEAARDAAQGYASALAYLLALLRNPAAELNLSRTWRFRIGQRLYATWDAATGFYFRKIRLPAAATVDDDTATTLASRILAGGLSVLFKKLGTENGGVFRIRIGNRLIAQWTAALGFHPARVTLPIDAKILDLPAVNLVDRLGGGGQDENASYVVVSTPNSAGRDVLTSQRKSDSHTFALTDGSADALSPRISTDGSKVFYYDAAARRSMYVPITGGAAWPMLPDDVIDFWGDSLTYGVGATGGLTWPAQLATLLGSVISAANNYGQSGASSPGIIAKQGGAPALCTVTSNQIAASGSTAITSISADPCYEGSLSAGGAISLAGTLAGVPGLLTNAQVAPFTPNYRFDRTTPGSIVACPAGTPFIPTIALPTRTRINIFNMGHNNASQLSQIMADHAAGIAYLTAYMKRYLIATIKVDPGDVGGATQTQKNAVNAAIIAAYPNNYIDLNTAPTVGEMATLGFVPDSYGAYGNGHTDAGDIAAGIIPTGMLNFGASDYVHGNNFLYALWALRTYRAIYAKGWFPSLPNL